MQDVLVFYIKLIIPTLSIDLCRDKAMSASLNFNDRCEEMRLRLNYWSWSCLRHTWDVIMYEHIIRLFIPKLIWQHRFMPNSALAKNTTRNYNIFQAPSDHGKCHIHCDTRSNINALHFTKSFMHWMTLAFNFGWPILNTTIYNNRTAYLIYMTDLSDE